MLVNITCLLAGAAGDRAGDQPAGAGQGVRRAGGLHPAADAAVRRSQPSAGEARSPCSASLAVLVASCAAECRIAARVGLSCRATAHRPFLAPTAPLRLQAHLSTPRASRDLSEAGRLSDSGRYRCARVPPSPALVWLVAGVPAAWDAGVRGRRVRERRDATACSASTSKQNAGHAHCGARLQCKRSQRKHAACRSLLLTWLSLHLVQRPALRVWRRRRRAAQRLRARAGYGLAPRGRPAGIFSGAGGGHAGSAEHGHQLSLWCARGGEEQGRWGVAVASGAAACAPGVAGSSRPACRPCAALLDASLSTAVHARPPALQAACRWAPRCLVVRRA